jgi:transcriptional regulator with XRE-family HTH domain
MDSEELRDWREAQDLTQGELAELLSVDITTISRWERNQRAIPPYLALALKYLEIKEAEQEKESE